MSRLRVLLVGRHLWPHGCYDSGNYLFQLAVGLQRRGVHVELMTPRYAASWPELMTLREIPVHRPTAAPRSDWSMGRYVRHMTAWLRENAASFDVLFADAIREEATAVMEAGRSLRIPIVLRHSGWGRSSDLTWWQTSRAAARCGKLSKSADRVVVSSAAIHRELLGRGFDKSQLVRIDPSFSPDRPRQAGERSSARRALSSANADLTTAGDTPVVLCIGRMTREAGMNVLAAAVPLLVGKLPDLRIWFIGDGPHRESLYARLRGDGVRASIAMPGSFARVDDLLRAADLFVQTDHQGLESFVPAAISAELPLVMADDAWTRAAIGMADHPGRSDEGQQDLRQNAISWTSPLKEKPLRLAILRSLKQLPERRREAAELRKQLVRLRPQAAALDAFVRTFEELTTRPVGYPPRTSSEAAG